MTGVIFEIASGSGEHIVHFASNFPVLVFQPSDPEPDARLSVAAWVKATRVTNVRAPIALDTSRSVWPIVSADGIICINMGHISPWEATLGLIKGADAILPPASPTCMVHTNAKGSRRAGPIGKSQSSLRSPKMKNPYWFNYWCGKDSDRCSCRIGKAIETDILLVLERDDSRRLALHIEIKRPGKGLEDGQAESYPRRAECWLNPNTRPRNVPSHLTIIVCGRNLRSDLRLGFFDKVVFHDEVANHLGAYPLLQGRPIAG
jgi:hypothetical protein